MVLQGVKATNFPNGEPFQTSLPRDAFIYFILLFCIVVMGPVGLTTQLCNQALCLSSSDLFSFVFLLFILWAVIVSEMSD